MFLEAIQLNTHSVARSMRHACYWVEWPEPSVNQFNLHNCFMVLDFCNFRFLLERSAQMPLFAGRAGGRWSHQVPLAGRQAGRQSEGKSVSALLPPPL